MTQAAGSSRDIRSPLRRAAAFAAVFCALQLGWQALGDTVVHRIVVDRATVGVAVILINALTPAVRAVGAGTAVHAAGGGLNIVNGCEGTETWFLLCAAFAAASLTWRARAVGLALGTVLVFAVNQVRILALFYANRSDSEVFNLLHAIVGPIVVIVAVACFFYAWMAHHATRITGTA
jgi:exosortase/archaeosortase family protein